MSNVLVLEELYYSVEYKNIVIFNKLVKKKFLNVVYNILELYVVQIKMMKMYVNVLVNYKNDIKYINVICLICIISEKIIDRILNELLFLR